MKLRPRWGKSKQLRHRESGAVAPSHGAKKTGRQPPVRFFCCQCRVHFPGKLLRVRREAGLRGAKAAVPGNQRRSAELAGSLVEGTSRPLQNQESIQGTRSRQTQSSHFCYVESSWGSNRTPCCAELREVGRHSSP